MPTTTQITNIAANLDLTDYVGDYINDYDMDAVYTEYVSALNCELPVGITLHRNGDVIAELPLADHAREIDWDAFVNDFGTNGGALIHILERHDRAAQA